ncbi:MAG: Uma2 family endonuclease [Hyphomicrobiaceae bacterium]
MAEAQTKEMTVDEFYLWCLDQEERYELVDGFPVPLRGMSGASTTHDQIVVNVIVALGNRLKGTGCRPTTADTALRTAIKRSRRPDVMIECAPPDSKNYEARQPVAMFEVLSPTTRNIDRNVKLQEYMRHPSLQTIVHIDPDLMDVLVYVKSLSGQWETERLQSAGDTVRPQETSAAVSLAEIYEGVPLPLTDAPPSA